MAVTLLPSRDTVRAMGVSPTGFAIAELSEVIRRCNPNLHAMHSILWKVEGAIEPSWIRWMETCFEPFLLPHLQQVLEFSARQSAKEIILLDVALGKSLAGSLCDRSIKAGQFLLQQKTPRGERIIMRLQDAIDNGIAFGHFTTLYGVRCGTFSIPVRTAILSYLLQELMLGAPKEEAPVRLKLLEATVESVNEFLRGPSSGSSESMCFHG